MRLLAIARVALMTLHTFAFGIGAMLKHTLQCSLTLSLTRANQQTKTKNKKKNFLGYLIFILSNLNQPGNLHITKNNTKPFPCYPKIPKYLDAISRKCLSISAFPHTLTQHTHNNTSMYNVIIILIVFWGILGYFQHYSPLHFRVTYEKG